MSEWNTEFDSTYAIPNVILNLVDQGIAKDLSWHNDLCPSFGQLHESLDGHKACIWVDHPDINQRENIDKARFQVMRYSKAGNIIEMISTNDVSDAVAAYKKMIQVGPRKVGQGD